MKADFIFSDALKTLLGKTIHDSHSTYFGIQASIFGCIHIHANFTASTSTESIL